MADGLASRTAGAAIASRSSMTIVTATYRYKPPPKRKGRKLAEITGQAVVTSVNPKKSSRPSLRGKAAAEVEMSTSARTPAGSAQPSTAKAADGHHIPANDDRKSVIVTAKEKPPRRVPEDSPKPPAIVTTSSPKRRIRGRAAPSGASVVWLPTLAESWQRGSARRD